GEKIAVVIHDRDFLGRGVARILRVRDGALLRKLPVPDVYHASVVFSPDGWHLAIQHTTGPIHSMKYHVKEWDLAIDKAHSLRVGPKDLGFEVVFSPNGKYIVFGAPSDYPFSVWSVPEKKVVYTSQKMAPPVAISPGGTLLLTGDRFMWDFQKLL